jgi:hypothetical protein
MKARNRKEKNLKEKGMKQLINGTRVAIIDLCGNMSNTEDI